MKAKEIIPCILIWILWTLAFPFAVLTFLLTNMVGPSKTFKRFVVDYFTTAGKQ